MRIAQSILLLLFGLALALPAFAAKPLTQRERNARAALIGQSNNFNVALDRQLDDELAGLKRKLTTARGNVSRLQSELQTSKGKEKTLRQQLQTALDQVGTIEIEMTDRLAQKDAQFARELKVLASVGDELIATPEGLAALEEYNKGGKSSYIEARRLLDNVLDSRERHRQLQAQEQARMKISDRQASAALDYDAMSKGYQINEYVIGQYEKVVALAPDSAGDWRKLTELYRNANLLDKAVDAARLAYENETGTMGRAQALVELGDAQILLAFNRAGMANAAAGMDALLTLAGDDPELMQSKAGLDKMQQQIGTSATIDKLENMMGAMGQVLDGVKAGPEILIASTSYLDALTLLESAETTKETKVLMADILSRLSTVNNQLAEADTAVEAQKILADMATVFADANALQKRQSEMLPEDFQAAGKEIAIRFNDVDRRMKSPPPISKYRTESTNQIYRARDYLFELYRADKSDIAVRRALVRSYHTISRNRPDRAYIYASDAVKTMEELATEQPEISIIRYELAMAHYLAGYAAWNQSPRLAEDVKKTEDEMGMALSQLRALVETDATSANFQRGVAVVLAALADTKGSSEAWQRVIEQYEAMRELGLLAPADEQNLLLARTAQKSVSVFPLSELSP